MMFKKNRAQPKGTYRNALLHTYKTMPKAQIVGVSVIVATLIGMFGFMGGWEWWRAGVTGAAVVAVVNALVFSRKLVLTLLALYFGYAIYPLYTYWYGLIDPKFSIDPKLFEFSFLSACVVVALLAWKTSLGSPALTILSSYIAGGTVGIMLFFLVPFLGLYSVFVGMLFAVWLRSGPMFELRAAVMRGVRGLWQKRNMLPPREYALQQVGLLPRRFDSWWFTGVRVPGARYVVDNVLLTQQGVFVIHGESMRGSVKVSDSDGITVDGRPAGVVALKYRQRAATVVKALRPGQYYSCAVVVAHDTKMKEARWVDLSEYVDDELYVDVAIVPEGQLTQFLDTRPNVFSDKEYKKLKRLFKRRVSGYSKQHSKVPKRFRVSPTLKAEEPTETVDEKVSHAAS